MSSISAAYVVVFRFYPYSYPSFAASRAAAAIRDHEVTGWS